MFVGIFEDETALAAFAARRVRDALAARADAVLGVATGSTPLKLYAQLRQMHSSGDFSLRGVRAFALDEYVGLPVSHPESYRSVLRAELVGEDRTGLRETDLFTPAAATTDPFQAAREYEAQLAAAGGTDLQILGIGSNGHIGFNEPGGSLVSRTHLEVLAPSTRRDNSRFFGGDLEAVPSHAVTQGLATILTSKELLLLAQGPQKAAAVAAALEGPVSASCPASVLQLHENVVVLLDEAAAAELRQRENYALRWPILLQSMGDTP
ncbi:6-phosphogluconolactonase [Canibacter oris]|uniref:Glucosamine-6-phosphate deaminase n=1 Tax=Canibacter oris TaxID=1365628 RepID=A0A840DNR2_9MICO|nr:glucosamine-6-phosphate deaminase [Canibacter oris]